MFKSKFSKLVLAASVSVLPSMALAIPISGDGALGDFTGTFDYTAANATSATISISLTNTTPLANGGYLTAFVFNNPSDLIASVTSFSSSDTDFALLGGPTFNDSVSGAPFGQFDIGSSTGSSFEGGGSPSAGIAIGNSATFTIVVGGTSLDTLTAAIFFSTLSEGTGAGEGYEAFVVRFRGFANGGSDKVPGTPDDTPRTDVPEPATMALLSLGLVGAAFKRRAANN